MKNFSAMLRQLQADMNVSEFARFLGMKQQTLNNYMKGRVPTVESVVTVCKKCGVDSDWLLGLKEESGLKDGVVKPASRVDGECRECRIKDATIAEQKVELSEQRSIIMALSGAKQARLSPVEIKSGGGEVETLRDPVKLKHTKGRRSA